MCGQVYVYAMSVRHGKAKVSGGDSLQGVLVHRYVHANAQSTVVQCVGEWRKCSE